MGYNGNILIFEPIKSQYKQLVINPHNENYWEVYERSAISNTNDTIEIIISSNFGSSSILPMYKLHESSAPDSQYVSKKYVPIFTLDSVFEQFNNCDNFNLFLKLDVQGYKEKELNGVVQNISKFKGIICELSLTHLYDK